jgi:methionine-gamma-lyase
MPAMDGFSTRAVRAAMRGVKLGQRPNSVPIYQSATFSTADSDELAAILTDEQAGYAYSRIDNPTASALAAAVAELEGAPAGHAFASGMGAIHGALVAELSAGDHVVASASLYGSTRALLSGILRRLGVETTFVDGRDADAVAAAFRPTTRVLYLETIANPTIVVVDIERLAALGHAHGATVIVDNTFASPYLCQPLALGADVVVHSGTKYLGGHGDVIAGVVVGDERRIREVRDVAIDTGGALAPFSAWLVLRGIETLAIRMERHCENALGLARSLEGQPGVRSVLYPGLSSHPDAAVAARELRAGGGMLAFELAGGRRAGAAFLDGLTIGERTASLGAVFTIAVHPPSTTHRQLDAAALAEAGIPEGLIRVSVGIEDLDDLVRAFEVALEAARAGEAVPSPA